MEEVKEYYELINQAKCILINKIKKLYPILYLVKVKWTAFYGDGDEIIGCFSNFKVKETLGSCHWVVGQYSMDAHEIYDFEIIETTNYDDINFDLLLNIDKELNMKYYGEMI